MHKSVELYYNGAKKTLKVTELNRYSCDRSTYVGKITVISLEKLSSACLFEDNNEDQNCSSIDLCFGGGIPLRLCRIPDKDALEILKIIENNIN